MKVDSEFESVEISIDKMLKDNGQVDVLKKNTIFLPMTIVSFKQNGVVVVKRERYLVRHKF